MVLAGPVSCQIPHGDRRGGAGITRPAELLAGRAAALPSGCRSSRVEPRLPFLRNTLYQV